MTCAEAKRLTDSFLAEELLVETNHELLAHLSGCPACRMFFDDRRRLRGALRDAWERSEELAPRPEFLASLATNLKQGASPARRPAAWWRRWSSLAAAAVLVVAAGLAGRTGIGAFRLSALLHAAAGDHQNCAVAFRLNEKPIGLERAAREFDPSYRSLRTLELPASGPGGPIRILERHVCVFEGRRFAHIVLDYHGEKVSLLVAEGNLPGSAPATRQVNGLSVAAYPAARHAVLVVAALDPADTSALGETVAPNVVRVLEGS